MYLYSGCLLNPWIYSFYFSLECFSARKSSLAIYDRHASRVTAPRPSAQGGDVSICWRKCIPQTRPWVPSLLIKWCWERPRLQSRLTFLRSLGACMKWPDKVIQQKYFLRLCYFCSTGMATASTRITGSPSRNGPFQIHCWHFSFYIAPTKYGKI